MGAAPYEALCQAVRDRPPLAAVVLGSGLNQVVDRIPCLISVPFSELPEMPRTAVAGHRGQLGLFDFAGRSFLAFQGRVHFYEGHSWEGVARPVRLAAELGARVVILTNASGGIGEKQIAGSLMAIRNHIAAQRLAWWQSIDANRTSPYSTRLLEMLKLAARDSGEELPDGTYAGVTGPNYETPAEVRAFRALGANAVGMSTVHEAMVAAEMGMEVAGITCVANRAAGLSASPLSHAEVLAAVSSAAARITSLVRAFLCRLKNNAPA